LEKLSDNQLAELSLEDIKYFEVLVSRYENKLLNYILRKGKYSVQEAEDILQEIFIKTWKNLNSFDQQFAFSTWIYTIARNETYSFFRKWSKTKDDIPLEKIEFKFHHEDDLSNQVNQTLNKEHVVKSLNQLTTNHKEIIQLYYIEEMSYKEISKILKKPENTIATNLRRAKAKFKQIWQANNQSDE
jgi:RNA polymerase sigma-70 factor (ECF subfamily)